MNPDIDSFYDTAKTWRSEYALLRRIALECDLEEQWKWRHPCYTSAGRNIVLVHGFKDYCAYLFFKGALMPDPEGLLVRQTDNVQAARQIRFRSVAEITRRRSALKSYIREAIRIEASGAKVPMKDTAAYDVPAELAARLKRNAALRKAFEALTPGRQRAYFLYVSGARLAATRQARVDRCVPAIMAGKGLDD